MEMKVESTALEEGGMIPRKYTCDGEDVSPPLSWGEAPKGTACLVLICDDPDAPRGTWVHWVLFNLPPQSRDLAENTPKGGRLATGAVQGTSDFGRTGSTVCWLGVPNGEG